MGMSPSQRADAGSTRRLCVVLCAEGQEPYAGLVRELSKRNMQVVPCSDPHEAFSRVCNDARLGNKSILVFDGADASQQSERLADAMERFAPSAVCWNHLPGANPPIQPVVGPLGGAIRDAMLPQEPAPSPVIKKAPVQAPQLRLTHEPSGTPQPAPMSTSDVLDADELDALLASELPPKKK
jgi:hypothetical protein